MPSNPVPPNRGNEPDAEAVGAGRGAFVPGRRLAADFYRHAVRPALHRPHAAALIGPGSDVLGYDTARSTDHGWGPRVLIFVSEPEREAVARRLAVRLPATFRGYGMIRDPDAMLAPTAGQAREGVTVAALGPWLVGQLGFDPRGKSTTGSTTGSTTDGATARTADIAPADWLATPSQLLAEVTGGPVFADTLGELTAVRKRLAWYPPDVWRYILAGQWQRIAQEEAFIGRTGEVGDELGSAVLAGRLARDLMRLWLLMARSYPPYPKWLGTAFAATPGAADLAAALTAALAATTWRVREEHLCRAYSLAAHRHNELALTPPVDPATRGYYDRPYRVIDAGRFVTSLLGSISAGRVRELPPVGAVDQVVDSTDVLAHAGRARTTAMSLYQARQTVDERTPAT
jgi:Domain of unknown function (DUF4037)